MKKLSPLFLALFLTSCTNNSESSHSESSHSESPHWSYAGATGPEYWASLNADYQLCGDGMAQSPINLSAFTEADLSPLEIAYVDGGSSIVNKGHTVQVNVDAGSMLSVDNQSFELLQFHFHSPSENTIEGESFPMEMHLVHANEEGKLTVLAVLFELGAENSALESIWGRQLDTVEEASAIEPLFNVESLLPADRQYYRFDGSLTTPPCSEGVTWLVLAEQVSVTQDQVDWFYDLMGESTNRPVQMINDRLIYN